MPKITLKSSDGESFEVDEVVAIESQIIKFVTEDCSPDDNGIPVLNVGSNIFSKVIKYCETHVQTWEDRPLEDFDVNDKDYLKAFDTKFVKVDQDTLFGIIQAANYLNSKSLLGLGCQTVADMIKGKTPEEIRITFNIKNDFTPEEK